MPPAHAVSVYCPNMKISQFSKVSSLFELERIKARSRTTKTNGGWGLKVKLFCHQLLYEIINPQKLIGVGCLMTKLWKLSWKKYIESICQPVDCPALCKGKCSGDDTGEGQTGLFPFHTPCDCIRCWPWTYGGCSRRQLALRSSRHPSASTFTPHRVFKNLDKPSRLAYRSFRSSLYSFSI